MQGVSAASAEPQRRERKKRQTRDALVPAAIRRRAHGGGMTSTPAAFDAFAEQPAPAVAGHRG